MVVGKTEKSSVSSQIAASLQEMKDLRKEHKEKEKLEPTIKNLLKENKRDLEVTKSLLKSVKLLHKTMHKTGFLNKLRAIFVRSFRKDIKDTKSQIALVKKEISNLESVQERLVNIQLTQQKLSVIDVRMRSRQEKINTARANIKTLEDKLAKAKNGAPKDEVAKELHKAQADILSLLGEQRKDVYRYQATNTHLENVGFRK